MSVPRSNLFAHSRRSPAKGRRRRALAKLAVERLESRHLLAAVTVDFSDLDLAAESHWDGPDPEGTGSPVIVGNFHSGGIGFRNQYDESFGGFWKSDFAYSNEADTVTPDFTNLYSSFAGGGRADANFGLSYGYWFDLNTTFDPTDPQHLNQLPTFTLPRGAEIQDAHLTNTTYAALTMRNGNEFAKEFGGASGDDPDWCKITAYGTDENGAVLPGAPEFYLADFRNPDNSQDFILDAWIAFDLSSLAGAQKIHFHFTSSDAGPSGINTPAYFAIDDISYAVNAAPVLDTALSPQLAEIDEDESNPPGVFVSELLTSAVSDADVGAAQGLAIVGASNTGGDWQYTLNGSTWLDMGSPSETEARLLPSDAVTRVRFVPALNFNGELTINYRAWDQTEGAAGDILDTAGRSGGAGTFSTQIETAVQQVSSVNDAPLLDTAPSPDFATMLEDAKNPSGTLVKYFVDREVVDVDNGPAKGIAVTRAWLGNGTWQFSLDGIAWQSLGDASETNARLLPADATTRIRFLPKANFNGQAWLGYRAWDQSEGSAGGALSTENRLGLTGTFSLASEKASIIVTPVNDAPVISFSGTVGYVHNKPAIALAPYARVTDIDSPNFAGGQLRVRISSGASASNRLAIGAGFTVDESFNVWQGTTVIGTLNPGGGSGTTNLIVSLNVKATAAVVQQLVRSITFGTVGGSAGARIVKFSVSDGDGGLSAEVAKTVNVT